MPEKDPHNHYQVATIIQYTWLIVVACWGGAVNYISRLKRGEANFSWRALIGEFFTSAFSGVLTYWILTYFEIDPMLVIIGVAIAGHAGGKTVDILESAFNSQLSSKIGVAYKGDNHDKQD